LHNGSNFYFPENQWENYYSHSLFFSVISVSSVANLPLTNSRGKWMALAAALLGWLFDGFEMGMFPLVGNNALKELLPSQSTMINQWFGVIMAVFLIGAATGGVVFGYLGDRIGRVRAMSLSIFTYAVFTGLCCLATQAWHIAVLRFVASLGMGGEWALGVALVTELWPDRSRALIAGLIGAAANFGYLIVAEISLMLLRSKEGVAETLRNIGASHGIVDSLMRGEGWRLMMLVGSIPALLVFLIMRLVPESHKWESERDKGATSHWATRDLLGVVIGASGAATVVVLWSPAFVWIVRQFATIDETTREFPAAAVLLRGLGSALGFGTALVGFIHPVSRYLKRAEHVGALEPGDRSRCLRRLLFGASLAGVALLGTWGSVQWAPKWSVALAEQLPRNAGPYYAKEYTLIYASWGAIVGCIAGALAGGWLGRRITYALMCVGSFVSLIYLYQANDSFNSKFLLSAFAVGAITAAFYGWFPLYLPELFPTSIRATSQGFAFNFGRVVSAVGSLQTAALAAYFARGLAPDRVDIDAFSKAGASLAAIYLIGVLIIWLGPETKGKPLPERMSDA
jgi:MFS transporter, SHS family, sialic acid transporter